MEQTKQSRRMIEMIQEQLQPATKIEPKDQAICVHCDASHHVDADHQCEGGE